MPRKYTLTVKVVIVLSIFAVVLPLMILFVWSVSGLWTWPRLLPESYTTRALEELFGGYSGALRAMLTSVFIAVASAILSVAISIPAARALVLYDFIGRKFLKFAVMLPVIVPATTFAMGIQVFFIRLGLNDTVIGVILVHIVLCVPYTIRIMTEVTEATGDKFEIQARVLGASALKTFYEITVPMSLPGIISSASMAFIISFSQYFLTFLIGGGTVITFPLLMFPYIQSGDRTMAAAYSILFIATSLLVFAIFEKTLRRYYRIENTYFFS